MKKTIFLLAVTFVLALSLRLPHLESYPVGFTPDEAAFGYNAYSLLLTGKDEWGTPALMLPVTNLKSFGDYKLPLYAFLTVPAVKIFGLSEFSTRLPNAVIGSLAVISMFFLSLKLTKSSFISHISALFIAVSPWSVGLSRGAFEANLATFFLPFAVYLLLSKKYLSASLFFALSFYSYHSARFLIFPVIIFCFLYSKSLSKKFILFLLLLLLPGFASFFGTGLSRAADVGIFQPTDHWQSLMSDRFTAVSSGFPQLAAKFYYAKPLSVAAIAVSNYLSYFSPQFLFASGAGESTYGLVPHTGLLYLIELPLLFLFVYQLIKNPTRQLLFITALILIMPVPAALAKGPGFAANRAVLMLPFLCLAFAVGLKNISRYTILVIFLVMISLSGFLVNYIYQSPQALAEGMLFGRRELFTKLARLEPSVSQIRVSPSLSESHIYIAFFQQLPPDQYQKAAAAWTQLGSNGFSFLDQTNYSLGKYYFANLSFGGDDPSVILVGRPADFELNYPQLFRIGAPSGEPLIQVSPIRL